MPRRSGGPLLAPLLWLTACFTPPASPLVLDKLSFSNAHTDAPDIVLQPFEYPDLLCPDGEPATFYAVYREGLDEAAPVVIVFHSGAFDYVPNPDPAVDPLEGPHYAGEDRMGSAWAADKVFETLGLLKSDTTVSEVNEGTLPAVLADIGTFAIYPANCWGDLWHNETGWQPNAWGDDGGVHREGRFLAWMMTRFAATDSEEAADWRARFGIDQVPIPLDSSGVYLVGLGDGGRAVVELFRRIDQASDDSFPIVKGVLLDSTMDDVSTLANDAVTYPEIAVGMARIFPDENDHGYWSLARWIPQRGLTYPMQFHYSSADPQVPDQTVSSLVALQSSYANLTAIDSGEPVHVSLNRDIGLARTAVSTMMGR